MELNENKLKSILSEQREEYQRYMGVLKEDFDSKLNLIGEQFGTINGKLDSHTEMIGTLVEDVHVLKTDVNVLKTDVHIIKTDVRFIKGALEKKVDYEEFEALEGRTAALEEKIAK